MADEVKVETEGTKVETTNEVKATEIVIQEGPGKKALKWVLRGLALVATAAVGFLIGRSTGGEETETNTETEPANDNSLE